MSKIFPQQRLSIITLGVDDVAASTAFYRDVIGFEPFNTEGMTMFNMGGFVLGIWGRKDLTKDIGLMGNTPGCHPAFAMAYNVMSKDAVDDTFARLREADVQITTEPHETFWGGYAGYFLDPDGHAWEVAFNPHWKFDEDGRPLLPAVGGA